MFKKLNYTTLIVILAVVLGIYLITELTGKKERSFRDIVLEVDTACVNRITVSPPGKAESVLIKEGNEWNIQINGKSYMADPKVVKSLLHPVAEMKTLKPAANSREKWRELNVDDSTGIHVVMKDDNKELANFYIGRMGFIQPPEDEKNQQFNMRNRNQPIMFAHVRLDDEEQVYAVEGYLNMSYTLEPENFRVKTITNIQKDKIKKISFNYPGDQSFELIKQDTIWTIDGRETDSAKTVRYLNPFVNTTGNQLVDEELISGLDPEHEMVIEGDNFTPVTIRAYPAGADESYYITSSLNKDGVFNGNTSNLYKRLFVKKDLFFAE